MQQVMRRLTTSVAHLALPETYYDTLRVLKLRGCATVALLLALAGLAAHFIITHATAAWAVPTTTLLVLWLGAEAAFYYCYYLPRCVSRCPRAGGVGMKGAALRLVDP